MGAEHLVAMELKCEELRRAADDAEMVSYIMLSIFFAFYSDCYVSHTWVYGWRLYSITREYTIPKITRVILYY